MDVLDKITKLREERNWSEYKLSEEAGLTQSTISSWYRNNTCPTIPSLEKICNAFDITLSQFFKESDELLFTLNQTQIDLIEVFSKLNNNQKKRLLAFLECI